MIFWENPPKEALVFYKKLKKGVTYLTFRVLHLEGKFTFFSSFTINKFYKKKRKQ